MTANCDVKFWDRAKRRGEVYFKPRRGSEISLFFAAGSYRAPSTSLATVRVFHPGIPSGNLTRDPAVGDKLNCMISGNEGSLSVERWCFYAEWLEALEKLEDLGFPEFSLVQTEPRILRTPNLTISTKEVVSVLWKGRNLAEAPSFCLVTSSFSRDTGIEWRRRLLKENRWERFPGDPRHRFRVAHLPFRRGDNRVEVLWQGNDLDKAFEIRARDGGQIQEFDGKDWKPSSRPLEKEQGANNWRRRSVLA